MNRRLYRNRCFLVVQKIICTVLIFSFAFSNLGSFLSLPFFDNVPEVEAAQVTIENTAFATGASHLQAGSQTVFVSDQVGYKFFRNVSGLGGECVYKKTTNGGATWGSQVLVDDQGAGIDCLGIAVWYDRWTPGNSGDYIHVATFDDGTDDVFYNRIDTANSDTRLTGATAVAASAQGNSNALLANTVSITLGTDGTVYIAQDDATDSFVVECSASCNLVGSWTETGTRPQDLANDYSMLVPLASGDIMIINRDISADLIRYKIWDNTAWSVAWINIDAAAPDSATYTIGMSAAISPTTGDIYLAYTARNVALGTDDQVRTARYTGGAWSATKQVVRFTEKGVTNVAIALDASNDDVYVAYSLRSVLLTTNTSNIYWRKSTDNMVSWTFEQGPLNSSADDFYGIDINMQNTERLYVSWFDNTDDDIDGDTLTDLVPGINVTSEEFLEVNSNDSYTQTTIDNAVGANGTSHIQSGAQTVFISDQTGYKFYRDSTGICVYSKTTNGGSLWGAAVTVDAQTDCHQVTVWYDRWTPGDTGTNIHIATMDVGNDDVWYNRLDTSSDTRLLGTAPVSTLTGSAQGASTLTEGENFTSITKGTDGTIYMYSNDGTTAPIDSFVVECTTTCQTNTNWTETGANPFDVASDQSILMPLSGGSIMLINRDISADLIRFKTWNNTAWSGAWTTIASSATENATYDVGMAVTLSTTTGNMYLAYIANNATLGTDDVIRSAVYSGGSWSLTTDVLSSTIMGLTSIAIAVDSNTNGVYVAYSGQAIANTAATANVLWKKSLDGMSTWSAEQGPINTSADDIYGVDINNVNYDRLYVSWFDNTDDDIYGATLTDLPVTLFETTGEQIATVSAGSTDVYIGGVFALYNTNSSSLDVTGITITENGTIDASSHITNIELRYELDTSSPYDCADVSYSGSESQFGSTDSNGFSGSDGVASFSGTTISVSDTSTLCVYPIMDVLNSANSSSTIEISIANPASDVTVTSSTAGPSTAQEIRETTYIANDEPTLVHYHWRNDDGTQATATSKTSGIEDTSLTSIRQGSTTRLRIEVSNEGNSATPAMQYRLEYASNPSTCEEATGWTDVGASGGDFDMSNSIHLIDGANTTDIANGLGGVTNENSNFESPNGAVKDTSSQTGNISLSVTDFVELEYSFVASTSAAEGNTYCFRVTDQGSPLFAYDQIPRGNIASDILVTVATSSQVATTSIPATNFHVGSSFVIAENSSSRSVTSITIAETGTIDADAGLQNIKLFYDLDTSAPYNCASASYSGGESQYGSTDTDGFSGANGTSTFTGSVTVSTTSTMCLYVVVDTTSVAQNGETINIIMGNPSLDVVVSPVGSISPTITRDLNASTTIIGAILTQSRYHWRNDNGTETTASSKTSGVENTAITYVDQNLPVRLRMEVSNEGTITSPNTALRLESGTKVTTCSAVSSWTDVGATLGAFDMYATANLTEGGDTTNIATGVGGVTDDNASFKTPNSAVKETSSQVATTTFTSTQFLEAEFSIRQTANAAYDTTYCFRLSNAGTGIQSYLVYPELTTSPERDFEIQKGTATFNTVSQTLTAGVDYIAPSASTSAFVRITNSHYTGAGDAAGGGTQNSDDVTAYISNPSNIMTSFTITRPATAIATTTRVSWEIVEFIGAAGSDNEMIVRSQSAVTYGITAITATGTAATGIVDDNDVVVFITGQFNPDTGTADYNTGQSVSSWLSASNQPAFRRGEAGADAVRVSYAVVEFIGINWKTQRAQHTYTAAGSTETESITAVNSLTRTFVHSQKRIGTGLAGTDEFGHEVWLSSIGAVSFFLESGATSPALQTSVAWIIENTQTTAGSMVVNRKDGLTNGGAEPLTLNVPLTSGDVLEDLTNSSIFANSRGALTTSLFPRPIAGFTLTASSTSFELWRSDTGAQLNYRAELVEWPTAGLAFRQNDYWFFEDNDALTPTNPWPSSTGLLGENTVLTGSDYPLGDGEHIRIRMSLTVLNATFPEQSESFKLQYGERVTSCNAISEINWTDIGTPASGAIWRGYNAPGIADGVDLSIDPPTAGDLKLTESDVAGSYEEQNSSAVNPFTADENEVVEYDWHVEQNGATAETFYCFRMIRTDGSILGAYTDWPQLRTSSFTAQTQNWRWYGDVGNVTPTSALAAENTAPTNLANGSTTKLRVTVKETENIARNDMRFKLQYSEYSNFSTVYDVLATTTCIASSTWCYYDGAGTDNDVISTKVLSDADACVAGVGDGCGTHNESPNNITGFRHENSAATEYEFALQSKALRPNAVYYFRLYDIVQNIPVVINTGESYPSLVSEGAELVFELTGVTSGTVTEGVTLDISSTPTAIPFGTLLFDTEYNGAYRLHINTNATEGYQVLMYANQQLLDSYGNPVPPVTGTNATPSSWASGCSGGATGCFGYHAGDDQLSGANDVLRLRFAADDTYARLSTSSPEQVMYSSIPINDTHDIVYRIKVTEEQPAGMYESTITYIAIPVF